MTQIGGTRETRREEILAAAIRCFAARGFQATTTREIAREAGAKQPLIFYHFGSKAELYLAAVLDQLERLQGGLQAALDGEGGTTARLRRFITVYYDYFTVQSPGLTVCLRELRGLPGDLSRQIGDAHHARATGVLEGIIVEGIRDGSFLRRDPGACAFAMIGILHMFLRLSPANLARFDVAEPVRQVLDVYCEGLVARAASAPALARGAGAAADRIAANDA